MNTVNKQELGPGTSLYVKLIIRQETPSFKFLIIHFGLDFMYFIQKDFVGLPSDSTVSKFAGIETRTVTTLALASQALYPLGLKDLFLIFLLDYEMQREKALQKRTLIL
jgi:hypothetical protein